jgi:hypothetical protein
MSKDTIAVQNLKHAIVRQDATMEQMLALQKTQFEINKRRCCKY